MTDILEALRRSLASIAAVIGFVVLWQLLVIAFNVPTWLLPAPTAIWAEFVKQAHLLGKHTVTTGAGAVSGLAIGTASALILAILMVQSRVLQRILMPLLVIDQSVPKLALAPIFVIWFGTGMMTRVVIAVVISFFPIIINAIRGMTTVDRRVNDLMTTLSASRWDLLTKIQLPNAVPYIFAGLKVAVPLSVIGAVVAEFVGADSGLGYLIMVAGSDFKIDQQFSAILILSVIGMLLFWLADRVERLLLPWHVSVRAQEGT